MKQLAWLAATWVVIVTSGVGATGLTSAAGEERPGAGTHTIFVTAMEVKGSTTSGSLAPPHQDPADLSKGYGFKAPGRADKGDPTKWQVASYIFSPSFVTIRQGDTVALTVFVVNGDKHEVRVTAPDGTQAGPETTWNRGREYHMKFVAKQAGSYQLACANHAPTMAMTFLSLAD